MTPKLRIRPTTSVLERANELLHTTPNHNSNCAEAINETDPNILYNIWRL